MLYLTSTLFLHFAESTTIALLAKLAGLLQPLREFTRTKPVWGTCAGAILLAETVENPKKGGQELLNGMTLTVARNGWGSQVRQVTVSWPNLRLIFPPISRWTPSRYHYLLKDCKTRTMLSLVFSFVHPYVPVTPCDIIGHSKSISRS